MQIEIGQAELAKALDKVNGAIETKTTIPVLAYVKMVATDAGLEITATDLELSARVVVAAKVKKEGSLLLPGKKLREIMHRLPPGTIKIKAADNHWAHVEGGTAKYKLVGMDAANFPVWQADEKEPVSIDGQAFKRAVEMTAFSVSQEESRFTLRGICINAGDVVGTDGHRLSIFRHETFKPFKDIVVPVGGASLVASLIDGEGQLTVTVGESHLVFSCGEWTVKVRKMEGKFPNYHTVLPKKADAPIRAKFNAALFHERIERVGLSARNSKDSGSHGMSFAFTAGGITLEASSPDHGEASDSMAIECDKDLKIGLNYRYIADFLQRVDGEVEMFGKDEQSAVLLEQGDCTYVAMPMRL